jgi:signal transduction histidine kinase/ligand-binding sensor domain-containing protein/DNA-binding response OmpR family regulator
MKKLLFFLTLTASFLKQGQVYAQPEHYKFTHVDVNQGLSHNQVTCFLKDRKGFLWIGTLSGLNRFDGYSIKVFRNDSQDSTSIADNSIGKLFETPDGKIGIVTGSGLVFYDPEHEVFQSNAARVVKPYGLQPFEVADIIKDKSNNFWFLKSTTGLVRVDSARNISSITHTPGDTTSISPEVVTAVEQGLNNSYWIIHSNGILEKLAFTGKAYRVVYRMYGIQKRNNSIKFNYRILADKDGDLWIYANNDNQGVYYFNSKNGTTQHIHEKSPGLTLNTNIVASIAQDNNGMIWVGTDHGGINLIDKNKRTVSYLSHRDEDEKSLSQNSVTSLYRDDEGIIWIGTFKKGLSYYHENIIRFPLFQHSALDKTSLPYDDVNRFVEDRNGNLWIGSNGGGLIYYDRKKGTFRQFKNDPRNATSISSDVIVSLFLDKENILWIGTFYAGLNSYDGKKFTRYNHDPANPSSLAGRSVWEIFEDSRGRLWIGTLDGGLDLWNEKEKTFLHYKSGDDNSVQSSYISSITEDKAGNIWVGTGAGIDVLIRATGRFVHYQNEKKNPETLSDNGVLDIRVDSKGQVWVGTHGGLNRFDPTTRKFNVFKERDGLSHNSILTILEDDNGNLWMSTPNGLTNMIADSKSLTTYRFKNYDEADGLQGKQFNENAALKTKNGELIFGGANGFNIFKPAQLGLNTNPPQVVLSDFQLFNKSVTTGEEIDGRIILEKSITEVKEIVLPANKNVFSIEFAALNYFHPEKNEYKYRLEGFNSDWLSADGKSRKVTYTNLDPGDYVFSVKAANNDGFWNDKGAHLKITVLPPFWKTRTAFVLYVLIVIGSLLLTRRLIQQREHMKFAIRQEREESLRMHELDMMKIKFFTNVSHEFRTPLTLILTPLEKMMKQAKEPDQQNQFLLIQRNAKRLLNLVNQLLDFRKLEVQELRFNAVEGDIVTFIKDTVYSFSDLSEKKDIRLEFHSPLNSLETIFDQDKLEKILYNLLSNAFKFTPEHGAVSVEVKFDNEGESKWLQIDVRDTGIGIATDKQERIFDRFFQSDLPKSLVNQGSGIGLSITKEFVKIHGGTIAVQSDLGKGSCFTVRIPINEVVSTGGSPSMEAVFSPVPDDVLNESLEQTSDKKPVLLLVEDNEDFRFYLKDNLKQAYRVIEARDGVEGWKQAIDHIPDLIVSDVMMPQMNGIELCRKIKSDKRVSHIPIILLTARSAEEQKLEGFEVGTDEYITKPFNFEILVSRIRNLILQREKFQKSFPRQFDVKASELNITSLDEKFIQDALKCVEENVSVTEFSVEDLSHELGISRAHLYKKIHSLTGKSPLEFIRSIRLQHAAQLLERSQLTVAEVAYKIGFNNPKYFAKYFKDEYHMLPSVYAAQKRKNNSATP